MKRLALTVTLFMSVLTTFAQSWVDITSSTITNPSYDNNSRAGWTIEKQRNGYYANYDINTRCGAQESWWGTVNIYQTITLPQAGKYRLSVNGFFRVDTGTPSSCQAYMNDEEVMTAYLYAGDDYQVEMASYYSAPLDPAKMNEWGSNGSNPSAYFNGNYFCNDMENAVYQFENGFYTNILEFEAGYAGEQIVIGVRNEEQVDGNWLIIDNWKLEMYGTEVLPKTITLDHTSATLIIGQRMELNAEVLPSNTTNPAVTWASSNTSVATVTSSGMVYAKSVGVANVTVTSLASPSVKAVCNITVNKGTDYDNLDENMWANVTPITITNPSFDSNPSWSGDWMIESNCQNNTYDYGAQEFYSGTSDIQQTVYVPEPGLYRVGVKGYYRPGEYSSYGLSQYQAGTDEITAYLYANDLQVPLKSAYSESLTSNSYNGLYRINTSDGSRYFPNNMYSAVYGFFNNGMYQNYLIVEVGDDCELTIGVRNDNFVGSNWIILDDWTLEQYGGEDAVVEPEDIWANTDELEIPVDGYEYVYYEIEPENATDKNISVSSSNSSVASFYVSDSENFIIVYANAPGTATITIALTSNPSLKVEIPVTVTLPATGLSLNSTAETLRPGATLQLTASVEPTNTTDDKSVSWKSSNTAVATVSNTGLVRAVAVGTATITATLDSNTALKANCVLTVSDGTTPVQSWLDMTESYVANPNFNGSVSGWVINYSNATAQNYGYQSASYYNGSVSISGFAESWRESYYDNNPLGDGSIYQMLTDIPNGRYKLEADLIAVSQNRGTNPVYGVELFMSADGDMASETVATGNGAPEHFSVEFEHTGGDLFIGVRTEATNANWIAIDNVRLYWYGVEVKATSIALNTTSLDLVQGETFQLKPTLTPDNTTYKDCYFESSNQNCVKVDANGLITALKPGMSTITVTTRSNSNITANCLVTVRTNDISDMAVIINEVQAANVDMFVDPSFNYGGWIELYNGTTQSVSLDGLYISDDPMNLKKFQLSSARQGVVPAKGFTTLWFDHYSWWSPKMINLKLDTDGGTIIISNENGNILQQLDYPPAITRTSYARKTDGGNSWDYTDQPTPGASNAQSNFASVRLEAPEIDEVGGFYTGTILPKVINIPAGATLRYTLDGSTPTLENGETSTDGLFSFTNETATLRLRFFKNGLLASPVVTRSYIYKDRNYTLPVISVVSDEAHLYGDDLGLFVKGYNGRPGNGQSSACNWNMDWDRPTNIEYFNEEGLCVFSQEASIEASGGWSRAWSPHSFNIKANKIYEGNNRMNYQFFENKPFLRHKGLKVRNGGNNVQDNGSGRIKDGAIQQVVSTSGLYVETQSYKPVHVFHNGRYIGVENLREPNNKHYALANYGIDTEDDTMDQWKMSPDSGYVQQVGTKDVFDEWYTLAQNANDALAYERIKEIVDIEEYINYMAVEMYLNGHDWPKNNIKGFRERSEGQANSRFRFILFDLDAAFNSGSPFEWFSSTQYWTFDQLYGSQVIAKYGNRISEEIEFATIFLNMLSNESFRKQFIDSYCLVNGSVFEQTRSSSIVNGIVTMVNPGMALEGRSANSTGSHLTGNITTSRANSNINYMRNYLGLANPLQVTLAANIDEARLFVNDLQVPTNKFSGGLFTPITLKASAPAGYEFAGWRSSVGTNNTILFSKGSAWNYYDKGSLDGENWTAASYNASWSTGNAPLGYDTGNATKAAAYNTTLSYGGNSNSKYPTYYFRKQVNLSATPGSNETITLDWIADDGFVVYVNGTEAGRFLMSNHPTPTFSDFADTYANANPESGQMTLPSNLFRKGSNIIAVELHNNNANSTDIYWDAALIYSGSGAGSFVSTDPTFRIPESTSNVTYTAVFERLNDNAAAAWDAHPVKINEVSADNEIFVSDLFKKSDWIELYNTTDKDYDVNGMFLSDNLSKPEKFQIIGDANIATVIPPHGHLIIWCDNPKDLAPDALSQIHANFKLSNSDNSYVVLTSEDKTWADTLAYCAHTGFQTVGLFPDGGRELYVMNRPTIGQTNVLTANALAYNEPKIDPQDNPDAINETADNDLALIYKNRSLVLEGAHYARVDIYNTAGQLVMVARITEGKPLNLSSLPQGVYIATAKTDDEQVTIKFSRQ